MCSVLLITVYGLGLYVAQSLGIFWACVCASFVWSAFAWSVSCSKQSANMLNRFLVGMFVLFSIPVLIFVVSLKSDSDVDLLLTVIGCRTYSVGRGPTIRRSWLPSFCSSCFLRLGWLHEWHGAALLLG